MKIKQSVIEMIDNNRGIGTVMAALDVSPNTAREYIKGNKDDLTKYDALEAIAKLTGIQVKDLLEEEELSAKE